MTIEDVRAVADAVLYEGYLLYPYRASSSKNRSRWQFGVLGPPGASASSFAEEPSMSLQCLLESTEEDPGRATVDVRLRFLQLQVRTVEELVEGEHRPVDELVVDGASLLSWEEAVEQEILVTTYPLASAQESETALEVPGGVDLDPVVDRDGLLRGRIVRRREALSVVVRVAVEAVVDRDGLLRLSVAVRNTHPGPVDGKGAAVAVSLIGAHLLLEAHGSRFHSLLEPAEHARAQAERCRQHRCYPVLAGAPGATDVVLGSPIILYDHPQIAPESAGALFDSTEIDEILTLRVLTLTDAEKAEARATDPLAAQIIDRCDQMSTADLQQLHGGRRSPEGDVPWRSPEGDVPWRSPEGDVPWRSPEGDVPWWDPAADESVRPDVDSVLVAGTRVARGSLVRLHPGRRADAQDLFFTDREARVTAVLSDVDGGTHVAVVLLDDPAADLHEWYGRYLYFSPEEIEPLDPAREESRS